MPCYVRDIMTKELIEVQPDDTVEYAGILMDEKDINSVLIRPPRGGRVWRIFTHADWLRARDTGEDIATLAVAEFASNVIYKAHPNWECGKALHEINIRGVMHLPVVNDDDNVIGMISGHDLRRKYKS